MVQNELVLERAKNMSLANNFVTDLTSLVVVIDDGDSMQNTFRSGGLGDGKTTGMATPIDIIDTIFLEEKSAVSGPCNITLYSEEYHLGESLTFSVSVPDLSIWDFEEELTSVKVVGTCGWKIFTGNFLSFFKSLSLIVDIIRDILHWEVPGLHFLTEISGVG